MEHFPEINRAEQARRITVDNWKAPLGYGSPISNNIPAITKINQPITLAQKLKIKAAISNNESFKTVKERVEVLLDKLAGIGKTEHYIAVSPAETHLKDTIMAWLTSEGLNPVWYSDHQGTSIKVIWE